MSRKIAIFLGLVIMSGAGSLSAATIFTGQNFHISASNGTFIVGNFNGLIDVPYGGSTLVLSTDGDPDHGVLASGGQFAASGGGQGQFIADYCLNALTFIGTDLQDFYDYSISDSAEVNGLQIDPTSASEIAYLLQTRGLAISQLADSDPNKLLLEAGLQAAIWHLAGMNGAYGGFGTFDLFLGADPLYANDPTIVAEYLSDIAAGGTAPVNSVLWMTIYSGNTDHPYVQGQVALGTIPEPSSMCLAGLGLIGLLGYRRVRRSVAV